MIHPLNDEEKIEYSKLRVAHPYKLLWIWVFSFDAVMKDFEYILDLIKPAPWNWKAIGVLPFLIPIYLIMAIWKVSGYCVSLFSDVAASAIDQSFDYACHVAVYMVFVGIRTPYAIYTYMRFSRAKALIYMLIYE